MICKNCKTEVNKKAVVCPNCGCKIKKPIYKKWWFWVIVVIVIISVGASSGSDESSTENNETAVTSNEISKPQEKQVEEIIYETVDLQTMFDDLDGNAMKAEANYMKKNIEFECKIASFDSDGKYISVEPVSASEWNFTTALCNMKNDTQKSFLIEKSVGDIITIKGTVKSIGEILGYTIDIAEVY